MPGCRPPPGWRFAAGAHGKPELAPGQVSGVSFNLSHCRDLVAVVVAAGVDVGIDVESPERHSFDDMSIARAHFTPAEQDHLLAIGDDTRRRLAFLELWTAKEAFIKAMGQGLSMPLDSFGVDVARDRYDADTLPMPARDRTWTLARWQSHGCFVALAAGAPATAVIRVECREASWPHQEIAA
jgi:4'-phosphopantetheinyl transferase